MDGLLENERGLGSWQNLAERVLADHRLTREEGLAILQSPDAELLSLLSAAFRVRHRYFGRTERLIQFGFQFRAGQKS